MGTPSDGHHPVYRPVYHLEVEIRPKLVVVTSVGLNAMANRLRRVVGRGCPRTFILCAHAMTAANNAPSVPPNAAAAAMYWVPDGRRP
jgi:hypothetical protein